MYFHLRLQTFLTPFDILSLSTSDMESDKKRGKNALYLRKFLSTFYVREFAREYLHVERDVSRNLSEPQSKAWKDYRKHHWKSAVRGRVFCDDFKVSDLHMSRKQDSCSWWEKLNRVEICPVHFSLAIRVFRFYLDSPDDLNEISPSSCLYYVLEEPPSEFCLMFRGNRSSVGVAAQLMLVPESKALWV